MRSIFNYAFIFSIFIFCFIAVQSFPQENFEGKVKIKITENGKSSFMDYYRKGEKIKISMNEGDETGEFIMDMENEIMSIVLSEAKIYMQFSLTDEMKEDVEEEIDEVLDDPEEIEKIMPTGETRDILGYQCQKLSYNDDQNVEIWITKELGNFLFLGEKFIQDESTPSWFRDLGEGDFFPMLVIERNDDGSEKSRFEVVGVEKIELQDDVFIPPADFKKMEMPMMPEEEDGGKEEKE